MSNVQTGHDLSPSVPGSATTPLYVVGIGASAGGLDALERFFDHLPNETGMAFVVVQHLSPDFKSLMDELLGRHTKLPIKLVEEGMPVEADHVYLIPPNKEMIISRGRLHLGERDRNRELNLPIDIFFRSLAQDYGSRAVAIVMSGGGSDGSRGVRDIHEAGGMVLVQDADSAQFGGMPKTARDSGVPHRVMAPQDMPGAIVAYAQGRVEAGPGGDGEFGATGGEFDGASSRPQGIDAVYRMLQKEFGIDFTHYKPNTVTRRIERRLALARSSDISEYVDRLRNDRKELDVLYRDLLIGVTRFFRDREAFDAIEHHVLRPILEGPKREGPLRVWVAGCATGEEAYSLGIILQDLMVDLGTRQVKIFATDVHPGSLERAARAEYDEEAVSNVSRERLERYFHFSGGVYQVVPEIRQMVVFAQHDVIKDAPFTRVDLVTCRNLLIYLQPSVQQRVLSLFHFALNRSGALVLGPSEGIGALDRDFETLDKPWRIFRKNSDARMLSVGRFDAPSRTLPTATTLPTTPGRQSLAQLLGTYDAILDDVMPPSLLVTEGGELVHSFGGAHRYLRPRDGRQGLDVTELVDPELKMVLVGGLKRALGEPAGIVYRNVKLTEGDESAAVDVTLKRVVPNKKGGPVCVLVTFAKGARTPTAPAVVDGVGVDHASREQLAALEAELSHTKENLQAAVEELQASNEELQASNEELQASNEELQSTNEELQSVNEELYTVNAEYQRKIGELTELTNDMDNLLSSTDVGTIFLDSELRIRKFTPRMADTFKLVTHDIGRPIETFAHQIDHPTLVGDLKRVLDNGEPIEREVRDASGKTFFLRLLPYRVKGSADGVVLTLIDVTGLKAAEDALFHERYLLDSLLAGVPDAIYFKDAGGKFIRANDAMARRLGVADPRTIAGKSVFEVTNQEGALALHQEDQTVLRSGEPQHEKLEKRSDRGGDEEWDMVTRLPLRDARNAIVGVIVVFRNVTEQKQADEKIKEAVRRRDQFLAMLSHELRNPLGAIVTATALLKSETQGAEADRFLEVLDRQSKQMSGLLDDLLEASRVTQNKIELKKRVVDLKAISRDAADAARALADAAGVELSVRIDAAPLTVDGDPTRLQQIQVNLLSNATKYTPRGGHVWLEVEADGREAVIRVRDDGTGIPPDMLHSVFDLFVQSSRTLDRSAGGLGLGLTLVRALVSMHGGSVAVESEGEGRGSEFVVRLPLVEAEAVEPTSLGRSRRARRGTRVLIVEDNDDSRELLTDLLVGAGFDCRSTDASSTALEMIGQFDPEIGVFDLGLPGMDGFELARCIRHDLGLDGIYLVALTGYGRSSDRKLAREAGFDEHLLKPVRPDQLLSVLDGAFDRVDSAQRVDGASAWIDRVTPRGIASDSRHPFDDERES